MRRFVPLLFVVVCGTNVAAQPCVESLCLGPEQELVAPRWAPATGRVDFSGAATNGERVLLAWTKVDDNEHWLVNYVAFPGQRPIALPTTEQGTGVVWSGRSFFVVTRSEAGGHLIPLSVDGIVGAPRELGLEMGVLQSASNGDGFLVATSGRSTSSLHARLFDRDGNLLHDLPSLDAPLSTISTSGKDYVIADRLIIHPDGSHERPSGLPKEGAIAAAGSVFIGGRQVHLGDTPYAPPASDGSTVLLFTANALQRYAAEGTLIDSTPGTYDWPYAVLPRRNLPPLLIWMTKDRVLHDSDSALVLERITDEDDPVASSDGASTVVAWRDANGIAVAVLGRTDEPRRPIELPGSARTSRISAISIRGVHYIVWRDDSAIRMLRLGAHGQLLDPAPLLLAQAKPAWWTDRKRGPALASDGRGLLVVWTETESVRAATVTLKGRVGKAFVVAEAAKERAPFAVEAIAEDGGTTIFWLDASRFQVYDAPQPPYQLFSAAVRSGVASSPTIVASGVLYAQRVALAPRGLLWSEYRVPFYGPEPRPDKPEPSFIVMRTVALNRGGVPAAEPAEIVALRRMTFEESAATDLTSLALPGGGALALWTEHGAIMAMPLDRNYVRAGDPRQIGAAMTGTLRVVPAKEGALLVYARREGGSSRVFLRTMNRR